MRGARADNAAWNVRSRRIPSQIDTDLGIAEQTAGLARSNQQRRLGARAANQRAESGRHDTTEGQSAEEALAARIAAVGRKTQETFDCDEGSSLHAVSRDEFEIKISALRTMDVAREWHRHAPSIKAALACVATPGSQARERGDEVQWAVAV
jgi:hypothetical protein